MRTWRRPVTPEESATILRLHHVEEWPVGTIGKELGRHHDTVEGVLAGQGGNFAGVFTEGTSASLSTIVSLVKQLL